MEPLSLQPLGLAPLSLSPLGLTALGASDGGGEEPSTDVATITVPASSVGSDLTGFPTPVDLADMPAAFWSGVDADGGNIRVLDAGATRLPAYVSRLDLASEGGWLWFKPSSLSSSIDNVFTLDLEGTAQAVTDTYGRNAVWSDYLSVHLFGETPHDQSGVGDDLRMLVEPNFFEDIAQSPDINCHEGIATDGTYYYGFDSNAIRKFDLSWSLVDENTDPAGDSGIGGYDSCGGGDVFGGNVYVVIGNAAGTANSVGVYDATDLSFVRSFVITTNALNAGNVAYNPDDGLLYMIRYSDGTQIHKYDPSDGSYEGAINVVDTDGAGANLVQCQGIAIWRGAIWASLDSNDETYRVEMDGTVHEDGMFGLSGVSYEGISPSADGEGLLQLADGGASEIVHTFKPWNVGLGAGGGFDTTADRAIADLAASPGTTFMMAVTIETDDNTQDIPMCLVPAGTVGTGGVFVINDDVGAGVDQISIWDSSNGFQYTSPVFDPVIGTPCRVHVTYEGTTRRSIYVNGGSKGTDTTITARGTSVPHLVFGSGREGSANDSFNGRIAFGYLRATIPANVDAWIAAEYAALADNASFLTVAAA